VYSARRRRRYAQPNRHSSVKVISRRTSGQSLRTPCTSHVDVAVMHSRTAIQSVEVISRRTSSQCPTDAVYSARLCVLCTSTPLLRTVEPPFVCGGYQFVCGGYQSSDVESVLRTSTLPLRTAEPPFVCGGYQSSDVKSVINEPCMLRTSPCTPIVDAAVTHSRTNHSSVEVTKSSDVKSVASGLRVLRTSTPPLRTVEPPFVCGGYQSSDVKSVSNGRRVLRTSPCTPHVDAAVTHSRTAIRLWRLAVVGREVSQTGSCATDVRVLRTSTPPLRTVEPPFVCGGYQSSDVKSVINERRVLRTSPCTPHVDAAVTHSRTAIRLWRLSVVGRQVSRLRTPCTPHVDAAVTHSRTAIRLWRLSVVGRQVSFGRPCTVPDVSVYSARRRRRYAQSNRHSSVEVIVNGRRVLRTSTPPLRTVEPPFVCGGYQSSDVKSVINGRRVLRTSPCTPHVDAAVTHSRTAIRLWRLSVVGRQVSRQRTPCTPHVSVYSARRRRRYAQSNRHSSVEAISRRTSQSSTDAVYSARLRVLRTSTPPLRTVEPPFVCGGYQSSDVKSVVNGRRVLRTSPCTPHVDAAVTHSRTAIRLWRLSVVGRQVSHQRTPCTPHVSVYSARRRRRYAQSNRHSSVEAISRRTSSQSSTDAVYSARLRVLRTSTPPLRTVEPPFVCGGYQSSDVKSVVYGRRVLRTSTPPLRTVEPPFVCGGYQSSDVKSVINGRRVLRTSPCTPHVDAAVTHSRTAIRLWRLSVVGRQVSRLRTPCTPHVDAAVTHSRTAIRLWRLSVVGRQVSRQRTPCTPHVSVYSARRRRRYAQSNRHSSVEVISRRTSSQSSDAVYSARLRVLRTSTPPLRTVEPPFV
jgi:rRNA maturation protein Rpf1